MLREKSERSQIKYFRAYKNTFEAFPNKFLINFTMLIDKLEDSLDQRFCALEMNVTLSGAQQCTNSVHSDAALLHETIASSLQLLQPIVIGCIHHT